MSLNTHPPKLIDKIIISMQFCFQTKLAILEQKLLKEEHERQLVQEKADKVSPYTLFGSVLCSNNNTGIYLVSVAVAGQPHL